MDNLFPELYLRYAVPDTNVGQIQRESTYDIDTESYEQFESSVIVESASVVNWNCGHLEKADTQIDSMVDLLRTTTAEAWGLNIKESLRMWHSAETMFKRGQNVASDTVLNVQLHSMTAIFANVGRVCLDGPNVNESPEIPQVLDLPDHLLYVDKRSHVRANDKIGNDPVGTISQLITSFLHSIVYD